MSEINILKSGEKTVAALRSLYKQYGYLPFKMSKFEEYELYVRNKEFLIGDSVITFNDTDGRLLALKPDVTLSIIKNSVYEKGCKQKVYYNENVYRVSQKTRRFKEIMQSGLECIGDITEKEIFEVAELAVKSLETINSDYITALNPYPVCFIILILCVINLKNFNFVVSFVQLSFLIINACNLVVERGMGHINIASVEFFNLMIVMVFIIKLIMLCITNFKILKRSRQ